MCTAVTYKTKDFYLGRTLDYEFSYGDEVTVTPRNYPFNFRHMGAMKTHYAIIGMAYISDNYPLYYDAANEKGLCIAGLNFVGNADYKEKTPDKDNIAQFELIPWLLGQCASVQEAKAFLEKINLVNTPFSNALPLAQLHWLIADSNEAITVESVKEGIKIYQNPVGVLTNNPPFDKQIFHLNNLSICRRKLLKTFFPTGFRLIPTAAEWAGLGFPATYPHSPALSEQLS